MSQLFVVLSVEKLIEEIGKIRSISSKNCCRSIESIYIISQIFCLGEEMRNIVFLIIGLSERKISIKCAIEKVCGILNGGLFLRISCLFCARFNEPRHYSIKFIGNVKFVITFIEKVGEEIGESEGFIISEHFFIFLSITIIYNNII